MSKTITNVFVTHTPFQMFIVDHMVRTMPEFAAAANAIVIDMMPIPAIGDKTLWSRWYEVTPPLGGSIQGRARQAKELVRELGSWFSVNAENQLFLANLMWPLNNALYGAVRHRPEVAVCNYPEGIGSLCQTDLSGKQKIRNAAKAMLGSLGGFPFHTIHGDMMGMTHARRVYTMDREVIQGWVRGEIVEVPPIEYSAPADKSDVCMFIGQNYGDRMSHDRFANLCRSVVDYVKSLGYAELLYKPHHSAKDDSELNTFVSSGFRVFEDERPVELTIHERPVACLVSFNSSALAHVKMMAGEGVRCIACYNSIMESLLPQRYKPGATISDVLSKYGVELWNGTPGTQDSVVDEHGAIAR